MLKKKKKLNEFCSVRLFKGYYFIPSLLLYNAVDCVGGIQLIWNALVTFYLDTVYLMYGHVSCLCEEL